MFKWCWAESEAIRLVDSQDADIVAWRKGRQTAHPWITFAQPLRLANEAAVMKIPRTHINCTSTLRIRPPNTKQRALTADRVWEIDTKHDLMVTEPQAVAEMLLRLVSMTGA